MSTTPDWIDLNDWIALNHPKVYSATKYLSSNEAQRKIWLLQWEESGQPDISECPILINRIDYPASVTLTQTTGHCVATTHGLHSVLRGESHCAECGAR